VPCQLDLARLRKRRKVGNIRWVQADLYVTHPTELSNLVLNLCRTQTATLIMSTSASSLSVYPSPNGLCCSRSAAGCSSVEGDWK
jgi:hypothetical protein